MIYLYSCSSKPSGDLTDMNEDIPRHNVADGRFEVECAAGISQAIQPASLTPAMVCAAQSRRQGRNAARRLDATQTAASAKKWGLDPAVPSRRQPWQQYSQHRKSEPEYGHSVSLLQNHL